MTDAASRRLLFLLPFAPRLDGMHGGSRTIGQLLSALAPRHRLAVLHLRGPGEPPVDDLLRSRCELIEEVERGGGAGLGRLRQRLSVVGSRLRGKPGWVAKWGVAAFESLVRETARAWQPDIIQLEYHVMGQYLPALRGCRAPRVLVQHDPGTAAARDLNELHGGLARLAGHLEVRSWRRYETAVIRGMHAVVVFTERDRMALEPLAADVPVVRIPIGTVLPERPLDPIGQAPPSVVFVGSFIHPPNVDAAARLVEAVFPGVRTGCPDAVLYVVGDEPPAWLRERGGAGVIVTGRVPDTRPYLDRAAVVVAPLRLGGGMRVKTLEALASGKAVVASPLALEGLDVTDGKEVLVARTDREFCEAITALLRDPTLRSSLARQAHAWARANVGWEHTVNGYERLYTSLLQP